MTAPDMLQILDETGQATLGSEPNLDDVTLVKMYECMLSTRALDERMINLQRQGRIGFYVPSTGEEAVQIGGGLAFGERDWIFPSYRMPGTFLMRGVEMHDLVANCFGNEVDVCKGRQMPVHYAFAKQHMVSISSPIGTHIIQAVGAAYAMKHKQAGAVAGAFFGDGGTSANDFHSGMNFAGVWKAPCVFVCSNNQWAISVPLEKQTASESIAIKAEAYGMPGVRVDGNDVLAVVQVMNEAVFRARQGEGPTLVELMTYRRGPHSSSDDPTRYRGNQADEWLSRDPILRFRKYLERRDLWSEEKENLLQETLAETLKMAVKDIESRPQPGLDTMFEDVYENVPPGLREQYGDLVEKEGTGHEPDPDAAFPL